MLNIPTGTIYRCHNYLDKMGKINQQSVQQLPKEVKDLLRCTTPARLRELAQMNCYAAEKIKAELDKQYGEGKYVIISLGRALSSICELTKHLGVDTRQLPMSGLRHEDIKSLKLQEQDINTFKEYMESIGLTKEELQKQPQKKYILVDYAHFERSLNKAFEFLKRDELLGDAQNFIKLPVNLVLGKDYTQKGFERLLEYSRFHDFAMVGKLKITNLSKVFKQSNEKTADEYQGNFTKGVRKLFWFNVFDTLKEGNYKNFIPIKEIEAIDNHYRTLKAIRNYVNREQRIIEEGIKLQKK